MEHPREFAQARNVMQMLAEEKIFADVVRELRRAREKFPNPDFMQLAIGEEYGEMCRAIAHVVNPMEPTPYAKGKLIKEAVQLIACVVRLLVEGDHSTGLQPSVVINPDGPDAPTR